MKYSICLFLIFSACAPQPKSEVVNIPNDPLRESMPWQSGSPWWSTNLAPQLSGSADFDWIGAYDQTCHSHVVFSSGGNMTVSATTQTTVAKGSDLSCSSYDGAWTFAYQPSGDLVLCQNTPSVRPCVTFE